jgi:chromosome segregation ATPase
MIGPVSAGSSNDLDKVLQILDHVSDPAKLAKSLKDIKEKLAKLSELEDSLAKGELALSEREKKLQEAQSECIKAQSAAAKIRAEHEAGLAEVVRVRADAQKELEAHQKALSEFNAHAKAKADEAQAVLNAMNVAKSELEKERAAVGAIKADYEQKHAKLRAAMGVQ